MVWFPLNGVQSLLMLFDKHKDCILTGTNRCTSKTCLHITKGKSLSWWWETTSALSSLQNASARSSTTWSATRRYYTFKMWKMLPHTDSVMNAFFVFLCKYNKSCKNNTVMNYSLNYVRETVLFQTTLCASKIKKLVLISLGNQIIALDRLWSLRYTFKKIYSLCQPPESNDVTVLSLCLFSIGTTSLCWLYKWVSVTVRLKSRVGNVFWKLFFLL